MADEVFTTGNPNVVAFTQIVTSTRNVRDATEAERAATEAARLALPAQAQAAFAPAIKTAQDAASHATQRAGILGSAANDAALAGKPAGDYRVGREIVSWSGSAVTGRTVELASTAELDTQVGEVREAFQLPSIAALLAYDGPAQTVILTDPLRGGVFTRDTSGAPGDGGQVFKDPTKTFGWVRQMRERLNVRHYGLKGDGVTDDAPAYNALIATLKAQGRLYVDLYFPMSGDAYLFATPTSRWETYYVTHSGDGRTTSRILHRFAGALFKLGRAAGTLAADDPGFASSGFYFSQIGVTYDYLEDVQHYRAPNPLTGRAARQGVTLDPAKAGDGTGRWRLGGVNPAGMAQYITFDLANVSNVYLNDLQIDGCYEFMRLGHTKGGAYNITLSNVSGYSKNRGLPFFRIVKGAGFLMMGQSFFTNAEHPIMENVTVGGAERFYMETMLTVPGTTLFLVEGGWDTFHVIGGTYERWDSFFHFRMPAGQVFQNVRVINTIADYIRGNCITAEANAGYVSGFKCTNAYFTAWEGRALFFPAGAGGAAELHFTDCNAYLCGAENVFLENPQVHDFQISGGTWFAGHRLFEAVPHDNGHLLSLNHNSNGGAAVTIGANQTEWQVNNAAINADSARHGLPFRGGYGMIVGAGGRDYTVSGNRLRGQLVGLAVTADGQAYGDRRVSGNAISNWMETNSHVITDQAPANNARWYNATPFTVTVTVGGGTVQQIERSGYETGMTSGQITLNPGEWVTLTYTAAPTFRAWATQ